MRLVGVTSSHLCFVSAGEIRTDETDYLKGALRIESMRLVWIFFDALSCPNTRSVNTTERVRVDKHTIPTI
jgi:hypothetical protein